MPKQRDAEDMTYQGFEQGPIRPPSEAHSLLLRVTRNCPWNRCTFCPVYKGTRFSVRPVAHLVRDIDAVYEAVQQLREGPRDQAVMGPAGGDPQAWAAARNWVRYGRRQVFLQDANSLVVPPGDLTAILRHLKGRFPEVTRITSYARSNSIANLDAGALADLQGRGTQPDSHRHGIGSRRSPEDGVQRHHPTPAYPGGAQGQRRGHGAVGILHAGAGRKASARSQCGGDGRGLKSDQPGFHPAAHPGHPAPYPPV